MRGRTKCPKCGNRFILEVPNQAIGEYPASCPECGHSFNIDVKKYSWEGETDEVVPPSLHVKPSSSKPMIAGVLLIIVFVLGIATGILFNDIIEEGIEGRGGTGEFKGIVKDEYRYLPDVTVALVNYPTINDTTDENGEFLLKKVPTGYQKINLSKENYITLTVRILVLPGTGAIKEKIVMEKGSGNSIINSDFVKMFDMVTGVICPIIFVIFGVFALLGGILSIQRKHFAVAIIGSVFGILSFGFFIGSILSIAALILILLSKEEFGEKPNEVKF